MVGSAVVLRVRAAATSLSARRGTAVRRVSAGVLCSESAQSWITCPRRPDRPRVFDFARGVSAVLRLLSAAINRICAATLLWTIVVLRDGRRCCSWRADVAQLVAHHLAKVRVAGSNPVVRSDVIEADQASFGGVAERRGNGLQSRLHGFKSRLHLQGRLAQRESASLTRKRSLVQSQYRAPALPQFRGCFVLRTRIAWTICGRSGGLLPI